MKFVFALMLFLLPCLANAYWLEASGEVASLNIYASNNTILVNLKDVDGDDVDECANKTTFAVSKSLEPEARARMYAYLLAAKTAGARVTLAFNHEGGCEPWGSKSDVYRKIQRLR
ncbi:hypothetical protein [Agaribacterium haliotis]|uniref:hypothetical protein n=1 Tax=Agaribacterium haliotis TaxID=2013869 RepID=UPI000BB53E35|nr:hypothetical protein [Agaribacterium haliotis]